MNIEYPGDYFAPMNSQHSYTQSISAALLHLIHHFILFEYRPVWLGLRQGVFTCVG